VIPTTVPRAAVIIGSGAASFEMRRNLTARLPHLGGMQRNIASAEHSDATATDGGQDRDRH
jgi:hypothetical protein